MTRSLLIAALVAENQRLQAFYFTLRDRDPEVAQLIFDAGLKLMSAIGKLTVAESPEVLP